MKDNRVNMNAQHDNTDFNKVYSNINIKWNKSKDDVWAEMSSKITAYPKILSVVYVRKNLLMISSAAAVFVIVFISLFMRFYSTNVYCPVGKHITEELPDGSVVYLNSNSSIKYFPYWWNMSRRIDFSGEAYFKVQKGKRFIVVSKIGKTKVLGTSFNIYSRDQQYNVTCVTGKVKVVSNKTRNKAILVPDDYAVIKNDGSIKKSRVVSKDKISWKDNKFIFTSVPLKEVFKEIARQYGVTIHLPDNVDYIYTGYFNKEESVEDVIDLVCLPFNIKFVKKGKSEYQIINIESKKTK